MELKDKFTVPAENQAVWDYLFDIERSSKCMPGVVSVEAVDDETYRGQLKVKVGPIAATFDGKVTLTKVEAPHRLVAQIEGGEKTGGSTVRATFTSTLTPVDGGTQVEYEMDLNLRGRLAQFGLTVVRGTAQKMTAAFGQCVQDALSVEAAS
jgi:carbon monoxide dehydrogenase subunit G